MIGTVGPPAPGGEQPSRAPRPVDASMSWLSDLMTNTLDRGYADATARRRAAGDERAGRARPTWVLALGVALVGCVLAMAVASVRARADASASTRAALVTEVEEQAQVARALEEQLVALRREIDSVRDAQLELTTRGSVIADRLTTLEVQAAATEVLGPGLVVTVDDAPAVEDAQAGAGPRDDSGDSSARVHDSDLQLVVNGLWEAGAEAVAVNDHRISSRTAIRQAGEAVLVDYRPLSPPYVVEAVGDPEDLRLQFETGTAGGYLRVLTETYGIPSTVETADGLSLPPSPETRLRFSSLGEDPPS